MSRERGGRNCCREERETEKGLLLSRQLQPHFSADGSGGVANGAELNGIVGGINQPPHLAFGRPYALGHRRWS